MKRTSLVIALLCSCICLSSAEETTFGHFFEHFRSDSQGPLDDYTIGADCIDPAPYITFYPDSFRRYKACMLSDGTLSGPGHLHTGHRRATRRRRTGAVDSQIQPVSADIHANLRKSAALQELRTQAAEPIDLDPANAELMRLAANDPCQGAAKCGPYTGRSGGSDENCCVGKDGKTHCARGVLISCD